MTSKSRFAPSPTGLLHIGNARSAILNWAHIKNKEGEFILRIDDTDKERDNIEYEKAIKDDLKWIGISWTKTFNQSNRKHIYLEKIKQLKNDKRLYPCFESLEELSLKRKSQLTSGKPPIYDRSSLDLSEDQVQKYINQGKKPHWRFKLEDKIIKWNDLIKGEVSFDSKNLSDPILIREDGRLLYHLPSVIDDIEEKITDVIRGEDHITNTAFHIQIIEALKKPIPLFGHHPFLTDGQGKGFSKRIGSVSIQHLRKIGFENITLLNYLLTVGTSKNFTKEKNINNLVKDFTIKSLATSSPKFSIEVLKNLNRDILKSYEFLEINTKLKDLNINEATEDFWVFVKNNISFMPETINWWNIINSNEIYSEKNQYLFDAAKLLPEEPFDINTWDEWIKRIKKNTGKNGSELFKPLRYALTGQKKGPEMKLLIPLLTREKILRKLGL